MTQSTKLQQLQTLKSEFNNAIDTLIEKENEIIKLKQEAEEREKEILKLQLEKNEIENENIIKSFKIPLWHRSSTQKL